MQSKETHVRLKLSEGGWFTRLLNWRCISLSIHPDQKHCDEGVCEDMLRVSGAGGFLAKTKTYFCAWCCVCVFRPVFTIKTIWLTHDTDLCTKGIGTIWLNYVKASSINILLFELIILSKQFRSFSFQRILHVRHNGQSKVSKSYLAISSNGERTNGSVQKLQTHGGQTKKRGETERPKQRCGKE